MSQITKKALATSLKKLMDTTSLDKITVTDIVANCGVNRQTFYYHFQDIYDLLGWIYTSEALDRINNYKTYNTWQQGFLNVFQYVIDNKSFCMNTYRSMGREHLETFLYQTVYDLLMGVINEIAAGTQGKEKEMDFIADFYTIAFIGLTLRWIKKDMKEDPKEIIENLNKLIEGDIKRALEKYDI